MNRKLTLVAYLAVVFLLVVGCAPRIVLLGDQTQPLQEFTLEGREKGKVLVVSIEGKITDDPEQDLLGEKPSMVQEVVSQLRQAEKDDQVKAVVLKIDSPGGSVTASDVLYHEIAAFKKRTGTKIVVSMMDMATSGGYYVALPADSIVAHPTTLTGSVGVIFLQPKVDGLMEKIGVSVDVNKSGKNKDIGSPFRPSTAEEKRILQNLTDQLGNRFVNLVKKHRGIDGKNLDEVASAKVFLGEDALKLGLLDELGYVSDALKKAKELAGLPEDARVVVYRRTQYANDNVYNPATSWTGGRIPALVDLGLPASMSHVTAGFYYLWPAAAADR
jgi:protease-4